VKVEICFEPEAIVSGDSEQPAPRRITPRTTSQAHQLALAYHIDALIASGEFKDIAHVARVAGVSRARVSQVLDLMQLAPWIQGNILAGSPSYSSHELRQLSRPAFKRQGLKACM
jgi:hypothetical protein